MAVSWQFVVADPGAVRLDVDPHPVGGRLGAVGGAAAQQGPDPGQQFGQPEGLGDVVVGAGVQADHGVHLVGAGGQHQDREAVALGAQPAAHLQAVHAGQTEVEHHQVDSRPASPASSAVGPSSRTSTSYPSRRSARASGSEMEASSSASSTRVMG